MNPKAAHCDNRTMTVSGMATMTDRERLTRTEPQSRESAQSLSVRYAELLRLRQEVRQAETLSAITRRSEISDRAQKKVFGRS
jgi:hypothetical protein